MDIHSSAVIVLHILAWSLIPLLYQHHTADGVNCYVRPNDSNTSCPCPCHTLQEYADNRVADECRPNTSNTSYIFLDGVHELFKNVCLDFSDSHSISLVGNMIESTHVNSHADILCHNQAGFLFRNCSNIDIKHLTFTDCGHWYGNIFSSELQATLVFYNITNLSIESIKVKMSTGYGLYAQCASGHVQVFHSTFVLNKGTAHYDGGNAGFLYQNCTNSPSNLSIQHSHFLYGYSEHNNPLATGLYVFVWSSKVNVKIDNITAIGNINCGGKRPVGGNVALILRNRTNIISNSITVTNSYIAAGKAYQGGGMFVSIADTLQYHDNETEQNNVTTNVSIPEVVSITNTHFISNNAKWEGGGLYVIMHEDPGTFSPIANITIRDCVFFNNSLNNTVGGGVAIHVTDHFVLSSVNHGVPQFHTAFINCIIRNNGLVFTEDNSETAFIGSSAVLISLNPTGVLIKDSNITGNNCSGIMAVWSSVIFAGDIEISYNVGTNGGGIILCDNSYMLLKADTTLLLLENEARNAGGGVYTEDSCRLSQPPCFFQPDLEIFEHPDLSNTVSVHLINNKANAGSAIYGGSIDFCILFPQLLPTAFNWSGAYMFNAVFNITHNSSDLSPISSDPYQVCFCSKNTTWPECSIRTVKKGVHPGQSFSFYALTVGQHNGSSPQTVLATLLHGVKDNSSELGHLENSQVSQKYCTKFQYTLSSNLSREVIQLRVQHSVIIDGATAVAQVTVRLKECPVGFSITKSSPHKCDCVAILKSHGVTCNIQNKTIKRKSPHWIGYLDQHNSSDHSNRSGYVIIFHNFCPYDFCKKNKVTFSTGPNVHDFKGNKQCAYDRAGVLCGGCRDNYSLILGNSECRRCTNRPLSLLLVFITAGLLLVFFLRVTDISASSGSMSGLIFYANVVQVNRPVFFGDSISKPSVNLCSIFISWLNLDFGIDTCFYNGMDAYAKTWLQFAFPLYVWGIAGVIILLSRRFPTIAGRNPVRVLATLLLLSYAKLLRTIITALAPVTLFIHNGTRVTKKVVWREDGNVDYFQGKHIPLFVVAFSFGLVTLPYAIVLFLAQWLQKCSHRRACSWVVRMKPLFDAYTGPYKTNCRFWTGSLLLIRVAIFIAFMSPNADRNIKLSLILATCIIVQMIAWSFHGLFQSTYTEIMNSASILNLGLLSAVTNYYDFHPGPSNYHSVVISVSVGIAWFLFTFNLIYNTFRKIRQTKTWNRLAHLFKETCCPQRSRRIALDDSSCTDDLRRGVTQSIIDPFSIQYREPLMSPGSSPMTSYGTIDGASPSTRLDTM